MSSKRAFEAIRPKMGCRFSALMSCACDAHPGGGPADAAFENVVHPEFPTDLLHVHRAALERKA